MTAYPSIAERENGGTNMRAATSADATRPTASARRTRSVRDTGRTCDESSLRASSIEMVVLNGLKVLKPSNP